MSSSRSDVCGAALIDPIEVAYGATVAAAAWHKAMADMFMQFADYIADVSYGAKEEES